MDKKGMKILTKMREQKLIQVKLVEMNQKERWELTLTIEIKLMIMISQIKMEKIKVMTKAMDLQGFMFWSQMG